MTLRKQKRPKLKKGVRVTILLLVVLSGILVYQAGGKQNEPDHRFQQ